MMMKRMEGGYINRTIYWFTGKTNGKFVEK